MYIFCYIAKESKQGEKLPMVKKIILVFKTHFDIGFTDLSLVLSRITQFHVKRSYHHL